MKNYYEILEVSEKASPEVIEKAYKALVKKYHPDLQPNNKKQEAENKIKIINEAYDVLSNKEKKANYDEKLKIQKIKNENLKNSYNSNYQNKNNNINNNNDNMKNTNQNTAQKKVIKTPRTSENFEDFNLQNEYNKIVNEAYSNAYNNAYNEAYINSLKNMGYEIKYERPFKEKLKILLSTTLSMMIIAFICFILWHIPFIKNYFIDLYNDNEIFKITVDIIKNIITSFFSIFSNT